MLELVRKGIHLFQSEAHIHQVNIFQNASVDVGQNIFQSEEHKERVGEFHRSLASVGEHGFQKMDRKPLYESREESDHEIWNVHYCKLVPWKAEKEKDVSVLALLHCFHLKESLKSRLLYYVQKKWNGCIHIRGGTLGRWLSPQQRKHE